MGTRSKVEQLPPDVRDWLDRALKERAFSGYFELSAELAARGYVISHSSLHRYGQRLERRTAAIADATEAAKQIAAAAPDDEAQREAAVMAMLQEQIFSMLVDMRGADTDDLLERMKRLSALAKNISTLSRASIHQKKHEGEIRVRAEAAAAKVARIAKRGGLSQATVDEIKREILGIAQAAEGTEPSTDQEEEGHQEKTRNAH
jgi:hypothetical protein